MKNLFIAILGLVSASALANGTGRAQIWCDAFGYDWNNMIRYSQGFPKDTQEEAEQSALMSCRADGLVGCEVGSCTSSGN